VFTLDPVDGLIGTAAVATLGEADDVARRLVSEHTHRVPEQVRLSFLRR
jgi:hypothetical protein